MTTETRPAQPEAEQLSVWVSAMARALDASDKHVTYSHVRFVLIREMLRQGAQQLIAEPPGRTPSQMKPANRVVHLLGFKVADISRVRKAAERAWNEVPPDMRTAARHLVEEMLPFALEHGYRGVLGRLDHQFATAAQRLGVDLEIHPSLILRVDTDTYNKFRYRRGALGRVEFPVFTTPPPDAGKSASGTNGETGAHS